MLQRRATPLIALAYFAAIAITTQFTRFDGGVALIWVAGAILLAHLLMLRRPDWPWALALSGIAGAMSITLFGVGPIAALPLTIINLAEVAIAAWLLRRVRRRPDYFETVRGVGVFVAVAGVLMPALTAIPGAAIISAASSTPLLPNITGWFAAHALGAITATPLLMLFMRGEIHVWARNANDTSRWQAFGWLVLVGVTSALTFSQDELPILFLPLIPVTIASFQLGRLGAAASLIILLAISGVFTMQGHGPVNLLPPDKGMRAHFYQFYIAAAVLTTLPIAAALSQRHLLLRRLALSEARYKLLTDHSGDAILRVAEDGVVVYASPAAAAVLQLTPAMLLGRSVSELLGDSESPRDIHRRAEEEGDFILSEHRVLAPDGEQVWLEAKTRRIDDPDGQVAGFVCSVRDISDRKRREAALSAEASTDPLTGVSNRRAFDLRLKQALERGKTEQSATTLAILDIDFFKQVNDNLGHDAGDQVLRQVAGLARKALRSNDMIARIGGEEFALLLDNVGMKTARQICERLRATIAASPICNNGIKLPISVTVSIGLAELTPGITADEVKRSADQALYAAKAAGRNRLRIAA